MSLMPRALFALSIAVSLSGLAEASLAQPAATPSPGSPVRKAIMDAMRATGEDKTRIFIVRRLSVANGWAWLDVAPQSRNGRNRYESESALLRQRGEAWAVVDQPCSKAGCDTKKEVRRIRGAFPGAPASIFP